VTLFGFWCPTLAYLKYEMLVTQPVVTVPNISNFSPTNTTSRTSINNIFVPRIMASINTYTCREGSADAFFGRNTNSVATAIDVFTDWSNTLWIVWIPSWNLILKTRNPQSFFRSRVDNFISWLGIKSECLIFS